MRTRDPSEQCSGRFLFDRLIAKEVGKGALVNA